MSEAHDARAAADALMRAIGQRPRQAEPPPRVVRIDPKPAAPKAGSSKAAPGPAVSRSPLWTPPRAAIDPVPRDDPGDEARRVLQNVTAGLTNAVNDATAKAAQEYVRSEAMEPAKALAGNLADHVEQETAGVLNFRALGRKVAQVFGELVGGKALPPGEK